MEYPVVWTDKNVFQKYTKTRSSDSDQGRTSVHATIDQNGQYDTLLLLFNLKQTIKYTTKDCLFQINLTII